MILVSIDDHMVEPPDMFDNHVPDKWRDQAPRIVSNANGQDDGSSKAPRRRRRSAWPPRLAGHRRNGDSTQRR